jgi:hypothetical protein
MSLRIVLVMACLACSHSLTRGEGASPQVPVSKALGEVKIGDWPVSMFLEDAPAGSEGPGNIVINPWFAFEPEQLELMNDPESKDNVLLKIPLVINPDPLKEVLAHRLREQATNPHLPKDLQAIYVTAHAMRIVTPGIRYLKVEEEHHNPTPRFNSFEARNLNSPSVYLTVTAPRAESERVIREIRTGQRTFNIECEVNAVRKTDSQVTIDYKDVRSTDEFQHIIGDGASIDFSEPPRVTREQLAMLKLLIKKRFVIHYVVEDPADVQLLDKRLDEFLTSRMKNEVLGLADSDEAWNRLSRLGYSEKDVAPIEIRDFIRTIYNRVKDGGEMEVDAAAKARFGIFSGGGSTKVSKKWLKEQENSHLVAVDQVGLPVGLRVHAVTQALFSIEGRFCTVLSRHTSAALTTVAIVKTAPSKGWLDRMAVLEQRINSYDTLPVGTVLPFVGDPATLVGSGWVLCDGGDFPPNARPDLVNKLGKVPNLMTKDGVFLAGLSPFRPNTSGGNATIPADGDHNHPQAGLFVSKDGSGGYGYHHANTGSHTHGGENRPPFYGVMYIMRVSDGDSSNRNDLRKPGTGDPLAGG